MARCERVAAISGAAAIEFTGWREMLAGAGLTGPAIAAIPLPVEAPPAQSQSVDRARALLAWDELPMVLCVGSHEPRKNHLAVLNAAETLWDEGLRFSMAFVGGNSWWSARFEEQCERLIAAGRPLRSVRSLPDDELWAAYRIARCVVFPSLHEGFGLPVAEALACGTPVVTSDFGSMQELADFGGAVLVDPHSDASIISGLRRIISDDGLHARLAAEAGRVPTRSWDEYAQQSWQFLVGGSADASSYAPAPAGAPSYATGAAAR
jgi:glycosyltransferase involved in cell wall biosynthesis